MTKEIIKYHKFFFNFSKRFVKMKDKENCKWLSEMNDIEKT